VNLGTGRIVILVALVVVGIVVLANGFPEGNGAVGPSASPTSPGASVAPTGTGSPTTSVSPTPTPQVNGVTVMALNGTNVTGAGAAAQAMLVQKGYTEVAPAQDAPNKGVTTTTVYFRPDQSGQNKSNAANLAKKYFNGAPVKKLDPTFTGTVPSSVSIVVVVGDDFASTLVA
jgi:LytR cell envelope-related transcriptional attenuator